MGDTQREQKQTLEFGQTKFDKIGALRIYRNADLTEIHQPSQARYLLDDQVRPDWVNPLSRHLGRPSACAPTPGKETNGETSVPLYD